MCIIQYSNISYSSEDSLPRLFEEGEVSSEKKIDEEPENSKFA